MLPLYFNGKFYSGPLNGVHRVADRLIREVDALLAAQGPTERPVAKLLIPAHRRWQPELSAIELVEEAGGHSQRWEQFTLPRRASDGVLVNLANLAPLRHGAKILLIHDAQFLFPDNSYPWRQRAGYRLLVPRMARSSTAVLTVSNYSRQMLDLLGVSTRERTEVLHNGADHILEAPADLGVLERLGLEARGYALMFGSPKAYKNNAVVFSAFGGRVPADLRLVIVGSSRSELVSAGLSPPIGTIFAGRCDDSALRSLYANAHALLFPSRTEGFGLPPVEAMLCECPVIAAPGGAIPEICRDAVLYADIDDPESWREAIASLHAPHMRAAKQTSGTQRARAFTWAAAGQQLHSTIMRMVSA